MLVFSMLATFSTKEMLQRREILIENKETGERTLHLHKKMDSIVLLNISQSIENQLSMNHISNGNKWLPIKEHSP